MAIDLSRKSGVSPEERFALATMLHVVLLDEVARASRWRLGDAVLHGGTSIKLEHRSLRFSEDLDFMVTEGRIPALREAARTIAEKARLKVSAILPGSELEFRLKAGDGLGGVDAWQVKWGHPARQGKVMVKLEFYSATDEMLRDYAARISLPGIVGHGDVRITTPFPVAEAVSLWADKVKAIATRPEFKWRDAHDLAHVRGLLEREVETPSEDVLRKALVHCCSIYFVTPDEVADLLRERVASGVFSDLKTFSEDMGRWFDSETHASMEHSGLYERMLEVCLAEVERGTRLLQPEPGARP